MKKYLISCPVMGYLEKIPHEDGELNEALLQAFDSADFGKLHDVDLDENEFWAVRGYYSFGVEGENEKEALEKAPEVFNRLWDNGEVDCGDLRDTDRVDFNSGGKESFRISSVHEITLSDYLVEKVIENGFDKGTDFKDNCLFNFNVPYTGDEIVSMIPCIGLTDEEINEFDPNRETFKGTYNDIYLLFNTDGISHFQITIDSEDELIAPLSGEQKEKLLNSFDYHICAYDKDKSRDILCALSDSLEETKYIATLVMQAENERTDTEREVRDVPDIDYINIRDKDDFCIGWYGYSADRKDYGFEKNRIESILSVNAENSNEDMFLKTIEMLEDVCGTDYEKLDIRRKENLTFVVPDKYICGVMDKVRNDERYSFSYCDYETSLITLGSCNKPYITTNGDIEAPVNIDTRVLERRTNPLNQIPNNKLKIADFFVVWEKHELTDNVYLRVNYDDKSVKIPMTTNEQEYFKEKIICKEPSLDKKAHKAKNDIER